MKVTKDCAERLWRFAKGLEFSGLEFSGLGDVFEPVSSYQNPLWLLDPNASSGHCKALDIADCKELEWETWGAMTKEGMAVGRSISEEERSLYSYESCLNLKSGALRYFLEEEATRKGAPLSLLELGVGLGHAFRDFCSWSAIDGDQSRGLTLPFLHCDEAALKTRSFDSISQEDVHWDSKDPRITFGSCLHLRTTRRFDCVLSVWALSEYHPLGPIFGTLQGIAAVKEGGLFITDLGPRKGELLDLFIEKEILMKIPELSEKAHFNQVSVGIQRLLRRPTMDEMIELLSGSRLDEYLQ